MLRPWLGIPPGPGVRQLRFGEFCRYEQGCIAEVRSLYDIPGLAAQAGIELLPDFGGRELNERARNGRNSAATSEAEGSNAELTRRLVAEMIDGCNRLEGSDLDYQGMERHWHQEMEWHGPWGIGSARGLVQFHRIAQGPSVRSFPGRRGVWAKTAFLAQDRTAAFTGWPSLVGQFTGEPFRGIPPTNGHGLLHPQGRQARGELGPDRPRQVRRRLRGWPDGETAPPDRRAMNPGGTGTGRFFSREPGDGRVAT